MLAAVAGLNGAPASGALSLVKGAKCPTRVLPPPEVTGGGTCARLYFREWSNEWRIRCEAQTPHGQPPLNVGDRITHRLSDDGARAVAESCQYIEAQRGGYTTFLTLTLDAAARRRIETKLYKAETREGLPGQHCNGVKASGVFSRLRHVWESSLQREVSRFWDAAAKMYARGWIPEYRRKRVVTLGDGTQYTPIEWNTAAEKVPGNDDGLAYLWIAENPLNEEGERNPHAHVLMRWEVSYELFPCWAKRLERLWGQGFAHLEKLKNRKAAEFYIMKAVGYLTKGKTQDQGPIRGNRYGIAKCARAPAWQGVAVWQWGVMGWLIQHARELWREKVAPLVTARNSAAAALKELPKDKKKERNRVAGALQQTREKIKSMGVWIGRHSATFTGLERVDKFLAWAERQGWRQITKPPGMWLAEFRRQRQARADRKRFEATAMPEEAWRAMLAFHDRFEPVWEAA